MYNLKIDRNLKKLNVAEIEMNIKYAKPDAFYQLGMLYFMGIQVDKDVHKGLEYLTKAAGRQHADAAYNLAIIYLRGLEQPINLMKGRDYLKLACSNGRIELQPLLKKIDDEYRFKNYDNRIYRPAILDEKEEKPPLRYRFIPKSINYDMLIGSVIIVGGFILLINAKINLFAYAIFAIIGVFVFLGRFPIKNILPEMKYVPNFSNEDKEKDFEASLLTINLSDLKYQAQKGDAEALYKIGYMYYKGLRIHQDYGKAIKCFNRAAVLKNGKAAYYLGIIYVKGLGIAANTPKALDWFRLAAQNNHMEARALIERIAQRYPATLPKDIDFDESLLEPVGMEKELPVLLSKYKRVIITFILLIICPRLIMYLFGGFLFHNIKILFYPIFFLYYINQGIIIIFGFYLFYLTLAIFIKKLKL